MAIKKTIKKTAAKASKADPRDKQLLQLGEKLQRITALVHMMEMPTCFDCGVSELDIYYKRKHAKDCLIAKALGRETR